MGEAIVAMPVWFDERTVAKRWGVSVYTVQRERKRGRLKAKRLGGRWKYRSDWLREYEDEATPCQSNSGSENGFSTNGQTELVRLLVRSRNSTNTTCITPHSGFSSRQNPARGACD